MARARLRHLLALLFAAAIVGPLQVSAQEEEASPRNQAPLTFLQLNDVYSTLPSTAAAGLPASPRSNSSSPRPTARF